MISHNVSYENLNSFGQVSPIECYKLNVLSFVCFIIFIFSLFFNTILLWVFFTNKELRSPLNIIIIALTFLNLFGTLTELPVVIITNYSCRWVFNKLICTIVAFIMYFIGCSSIYLLTVISFERWYAIVNPFEQRYLTYKYTCLIIMLCLLFSLIWCVAPLFGWSYYSLEISLTTCSVEWNDHSLNVISYNMTIFGFVYLIPLVVLIYTNIKLIFMIRGLSGFLKTSKQTYITKRRLIKERKLTISILLIIFCFMISWTPYAIVSLISSFFYNYIKISPIGSLIPSVFAKTSLLWPSVLYIFSNNQIKTFLSNKLNFRKKSLHTETSYSLHSRKSKRIGQYV
ncbi:unnamed protein product [Brachionus calyciflorus]|uniref:G-protein coupled receptors family 1 profile domain-containing protein n=1 Tax=Brachionus calyciflorus TaxID=104777 RepID=A0A813PIR3_9BILA|nr:unnamed protein product [Brachionus calyciflorus]